MGELHYLPNTVPLTVTSYRFGQLVYVRLKGELETQSASLLLEPIARLGPRFSGTVIFDCENLSFIDARGLTALLRARAAIRAAGAELVLARPSRVLSRILTVMSLTSVLPVADPALLAALDHALRLRGLKLAALSVL